jgi:hypothetical protein
MQYQCFSKLFPYTNHFRSYFRGNLRQRKTVLTSTALNYLDPITISLMHHSSHITWLHCTTFPRTFSFFAHFGVKLKPKSIFTAKNFRETLCSDQNYSLPCVSSHWTTFAPFRSPSSGGTAHLFRGQYRFPRKITTRKFIHRRKLFRNPPTHHYSLRSSGPSNWTPCSPFTVPSFGCIALLFRGQYYIWSHFSAESL